ncbi:MAG: hypothetical protein JWP52_1850 [Rhizobacter sp.]|nr:hypothetical protein [Rhizobacter sp.]
MNIEPAPPSKRRTWFALVFGAVFLVGFSYASALVEPLLIALALGPGPALSRPSPSAWADSNVWLFSVAVSCLVLLIGGHMTQRLSPPRSWVASTVLLMLVITYFFFAQFPDTQSALRIALWSIGPPAALAFGAWLASRAENAA